MIDPEAFVSFIDDNFEMRKFVYGDLKKEYDVITAKNGVNGLAKLRHTLPDLIIADIMMPRMSGFEVCKKLKADAETRDIPIVMVTALNEFSDIERGVESGTDDFLTKPVNKLELVTRVKSLLRLRHLRSQLERTLAYISELEGDRPNE